jgi:glycerol uptake facilitator-like aquaporin
MNEVNRRNFLAEMIGTFIFVGTIITVINNDETTMNFLKIGLALMVSIIFLGPISGGAFNPVVSLMLFINNKIDFNRMCSQILGQLVGLLIAITVYTNLISNGKVDTVQK